MVKLAIKEDGWNLEYASDRLKKKRGLIWSITFPPYGYLSPNQARFKLIAEITKFIDYRKYITNLL